VLPAPSLDDAAYAEVCRDRAPARPALGVVGLLNVQLALVDGRDARPRGEPARVADSSVRGKATGVNLVDAAARLAAGARLHELELLRSDGRSR
jgi:carbamoylphosphate synthase large subunit